MTTTYMTLNNGDNNKKTGFPRRSHIERQLDSMEKLFDDFDLGSVCSSASSSSGESMANDVDVRDEAKAKVLQLWGGGELGSLTVDATAVSTTTKQPQAAAAAAAAVTTTIENERKRDIVLPPDTVETLASTDTKKPLGRGSDHGRPTPRQRMVTAASLMRKSSSADTMTEKKNSLRGSTRNTTDHASFNTMNESFTLDESFLAQLPNKGMFSLRHGEKLSNSERDAGIPTRSTRSSTSRPRISQARTSTSSSSSKRRGRGGERENGSSPSLTTRKRGGDLSASQHGQRRSPPPVRGIPVSKNGGIDDLSSSSEHGTKGSSDGNRISRRVARSPPPVRGMSASKSGGISDLSSRSEHGTKSSSGGLRNNRVNARVSRSGGRATNNQSGLDKETDSSTSRRSTSRPRRVRSSAPSVHSGDDMELASSSSRGSSSRPRRVKSSGADIVPRKTSRESLQDQTASACTKNAQWPAPQKPNEDPPGSTKMTGGQAYYDMKQKYQQSWDATSCLAAVNEERTKHAMRSLTRDKEMDTEAQKHAEAIAQSNGNYVLKIDYMGHVLRGSSVNDMHRAAMETNITTNVKTNILNPDFSVMGVGVATATNGVVYVCELFNGKFTLCCCTNEQSK